MLSLSCRLGALSFVWLSASFVAADEPTFRDLVRKFVSAETRSDVDAAELGAIAPDVQKVVALEYTVLLETPDGETAVDPANHEFHLGDRIRIRIQPLSDMYIYIFHEGASGEKVCLLPNEKEQPPLAERDNILDLPSDGTVLEFNPPAGDEKLIVVATETPSDDLAALADLVFRKPAEELTSEEQALRKELVERSQKTLKSIRERHSKGTRYRGLFSDDALGEVAKTIQDQGAAQAVLEEPPHGDVTSTFAMAASLQKNRAPELFLTIPLRSVSSNN